MPRNIKIEEEKWSNNEENNMEQEHQIPRPKRGKGLFWIILLVIVSVGAFALYYFDLIPGANAEYQAVFLNNGQVYFGKLSREGSQFPVLRDIYYLQVTQPPQPIQEGQTPPANINLVKLGGELHGPQDEMRINRDNILFVEDLKEDSQVTAAIKTLKQQGQ